MMMEWPTSDIKPNDKLLIFFFFVWAGFTVFYCGAMRLGMCFYQVGPLPEEVVDRKGKKPVVQDEDK